MRKLNKRWSKNADCCIVCGGTKYKAATSEGVCRLCWQREKKSKEKLNKIYLDKEEIGRRISFGKLRPIISKEELRQLYIDEQLSTTDIGNMFGVNRNAIRTRLHLFEIPVRNHSEARKICNNKPEVKEKLREAAIKNLQDPEFFHNYITKLKAVTVGRIPSEETRAKLSKAHKGKIRSKEHCKNLSISLKKWVKKNPNKMKKVHEARMKSLTETPKCGTDIEIKLAQYLSELNLIFTQQHLVRNKFAVDFFLPQYFLVVEADGDYWHKKPAQQKKDKSKDKYLSSLGLKVLRLWGSEINNKPHNTKRKIMEAIKQCKIKQLG